MKTYIIKAYHACAGEFGEFTVNANNEVEAWEKAYGYASEHGYEADSVEVRSLYKSVYVATIWDGFTHIERRVWADNVGHRYVKINGYLFDVDLDLPNYDVDVWYHGKGAIK